MGIFTRLLLGRARIPDDMRATLETERILVLEEHLNGSVRFDHYRAPGQRFHGKVTGTAVTVVLTERRLIAYVRGRGSKFVDVPWEDPRAQSLDVREDPPGRLSIGFDPSLFRADTEGEVAVRAKTPRAAEIAQTIRHRIQLHH